MTGFSLGLVATLLWIVVLTGLGLSLNSGPRTPDQSIRQFRATRRRITQIEEVPEPPIDASREAAQKRRDRTIAAAPRQRLTETVGQQRTRGKQSSKGARRAAAATLSGAAPITVSIERGGKPARLPRPAPAPGATDSEIDDLIRNLMDISAPVFPSRGASVDVGGSGIEPDLVSRIEEAPPELTSRNGSAASAATEWPPPMPPLSPIASRPPASPAPPPQGLPRGSRRAPLATFSKTYARRDGDVTYVVVDDEGRPRPVH